ncbi:hypothetical protein HYALB_00006882 [Hymenoscyphus albidus]|uniref:HlyIII-domain-containing protein n=1 Tax=Hymenoscyphus albidus TaxID=595503 RepID=A0A9N9LZ19_9HELO|nr:hypothetical protein HYALB_00006882 [Hymenoscyphus albidus]
MQCASQSSLTVESYDDTSTAITSGVDDASKPGLYKRRHSSFHPRRRSSDKLEADEGIIVRLDLFLSELERRLDFLESYGNLNFDSSISRAYATLQAVRAKCSQVSDEVIGAGRRRAKIMVETVESRYHEAMTAKETLNEKVYEGMGLLENILADFEAKAYKMREQGFASAAGTLMDEGKRVVDGGIVRARGVIDEAIKAAESLEEHIEAAIAHAREHGLLRYDQLPAPWQNNHRIINGYRFTSSKLECVRSMFNISNETVNIWSHAIGLFIVLAIAFYFYPTSANFSLSTNTDVLIAAVFFVAAAQTLLFSVFWHTFNSVADQCLMERFACVDYIGISLLVTASIISTEYFAFYCEPLSRYLYMGLTAILGGVVLVCTTHPTFNHPNMALVRVAAFVTLGASGFIPAGQLVFTRGVDWVWQFYAPITKSILVYLFGAFIYAAKVPERWAPGTFDIWGSSHQLWHAAVLGGILYHYIAIQAFFAGAQQRAADGCSVY